MSSNERQSQDVGEFFSEFAAKWSTLYGGRRSAIWRWLDWSLRRDIYERYQWTFAELGENLRGKSILDIGCGDGIYSLEAARRGADFVLGLDVAEGMVALCNARCQEAGLEHAVKFQCTSFPPSIELPALQRKFDVTVVMGVMDYVPDPAGFLSAVRERTSQFALISFPGKQWLRWQARRWRYKLLGRCAVFHYTDAEVRDCCRRAGWSNLKTEYLRHSGGCHLVRAQK
jgi:2-polyprenyl-3-methyl-5-hydroxy-6-metoxy-1,4-benzoquinol methylase